MALAALFTAVDGLGPVKLAAVATVVLYVVYVAISYVSLAQQRAAFKKRTGCQEPPVYPHSDFLGIDLLKQASEGSAAGVHMRNIGKRFERFGPQCTTFSSLSSGRWILNTIEPENVKAMLATQFKDFGITNSRRQGLLPLLGEGIFTNNGKAWEHSRAMLRPNFARTQVADLDNYERHVARLIRRIPTDGAAVDLQELFFLLTIDTATELLFSESTNTLDEHASSDEAQAFADAFTYAQEHAIKIFRYGIFSCLLRDPKNTQATQLVHAFADKYVAKAVAYRDGRAEKTAEEGGVTERYIFLHELAKTGATEREMRNELLNILLAGRDTTASLLSHLWFTLARRPDVFAKLRAEVTTLGDAPPTFEAIKDLKYLRYCMNEALRLYSVVPSNSRMALRDTTLPIGGGPDGKSPVFVKQGQLVAYYSFNMHRRKDLYGEDAEEFKPERWETLRPGWEYLPFNGGPRICIGQQLALTEASYTTVRLLQEFASIEPRDDAEWAEWLTLTMAVKNGVHVGLTPA